MPRVAWFTPLPPTRSGIAAYSVDILPRLAGRHQIDVFRSPGPAPGALPPGHPPVFEGHDFTWKHFRAPYDLVVYQLGNARCHEYMWPHLVRYPGLVVLHDGRLLHSRALFLLHRGRADEFRAEFRLNHPGAPPDAAELVIGNLAGTACYFWPMVRVAVQTARLAAVHSPRLAADLADEFGAPVATIRMGVPDPRTGRPGSDVAAARRSAVRARYGVPPAATVFAALGLVTPEKRISPALRALARVARTSPSAHVMLVGGTVDHYDARAEARALGVEDRVTITGYVPDDEVDACLEAADACLCLRWPTCRETSASWLRAMAAGKATIVTELAHADDVASLDPRSWTVRAAGSGAAATDVPPRAACVSVDIADEVHSLGLAMKRLAADAGLRAALAAAARDHWRAHHTLAAMTADYERAFAAALDRPVRRPDAPLPPCRGDRLGAPLPPHLVADGTGRLREMAAALGVSIDFLDLPERGRYAQ
jgi:glycosyltransferase involved in cell wall biosynthesis